MAASGDADDGCDLSSSTTPCSTSAQQKQKGEDMNWDKDKDKWIKEHMKTQAAIEKENSKVDEARLKLEKDAMDRRGVIEVRKLQLEEKQHMLNERRMALDEKRLDLDRRRMKLVASEKRGQKEERGKVLDFLAALATRLN